MGSILTDDWDSFGQRISAAFMAILMLVICQPAVVMQFLRWLWRCIKSVAKIVCSKDAGSDTAPAFDHTTPTLYAYDPPAEISRGNISTLSDDDMHIFLQHYYKADEIRTKVRGVSYRNDDGTDRQCILAHCHAGDQLRFNRFDYAGAPAYAVYCDWGQIGNLSAELAEDIAAREKPCILLGEILNVSGGYHGEYFGCNICLNIYEKY